MSNSLFLTKMANSSENFCLKWKEFQHNIDSSYYELRKDAEFSDVTLVCEEDQQFEVHKIILAASSPFFSNVLKRNKHSHPMIYMRGLQARDLVAIVDFIYHGEANVCQEDLDRFLALAEDLQLKGLSRSKDKSLYAPQKPLKILPHQESPMKPTPKPENNHQRICTDGSEIDTNTNGENHNIHPINGNKGVVNTDVTIENFKADESEIDTNTRSKNPNIVPVNDNSGVVTIEDLKAMLDSMMESIDEGEHKWKCTICGKATKGTVSIARSEMRSHIESHYEGLTYPCNQCGKVSSSIKSLTIHISKIHKK